MSIALSLKNLRKTYENTEAVKGITFDIQKGDFFGFLGPNGAGKTTTISMMTGLSEITSGSISVFGKDVVRDYKETRSMVGLAAQEPHFDPFFELSDVLMFQAGYHGIPRSQAKQKTEELLKRFGLWEHRSKTPRQISGGMKRRLLIAKALVHDPEILILDEPTAGVDVELRRLLWDSLRELNEEGKTIVLTTHYIEEAEELCNRIGIINKGEMIAIEDKETLMSQLSEKQVVLHLDAVSEKLLAACEKDEHCAADGNTLTLTAEDVHAQLSTTMELLKTHNAKILDIDVEAFDLEDIFMQMTKDHS